MPWAWQGHAVAPVGHNFEHNQRIVRRKTIEKCLMIFLKSAQCRDTIIALEVLSMSLTKDGYKPRLIDERISRYLRISGAVSIEGPKWCGKTWTNLNHANSVSYVTDKSVRNNALVDPKYIFTKERPQLIDEWQIVPEIWERVTPPVLGQNPKFPEALKILGFWHFVPSAKSPKTTV